ncbi:N-acyl-D-amino-acid deacylase [Actinocorallia herbida]|uniref:N-acyl-D-amino-acid deacylase n=1 Tax=Actinocorallia herbida TaxID=58109 RepID=A0A3N1D067_9ACTN|nr:D-aminoacylase [Actinocorallia herbida]ROO86927.1 N-acyl-D-amino-acid deacylase [Actinocorallia herbida]
MRFDLLVRGGTVIDGTGGPARRADVGVDGDTIAFVGEATADATAGRELDARGRVVTPGFIDLHSHADFTLEVFPAAPGALHQGVTTLVTGNCGQSPFPSGHRTGTDTVPTGVGYPDFAAYAAHLERAEPAVNLAALVGHGSLRATVIGSAQRAATGAEIDAMRTLLAEAARQGVFGLSTGLIYAPGSYADADEIVALAKVAREHGLLYATHMRDEGDGLLDSITEALDTARRSGVRLQISHLKAVGPANHGKVGDALELIERARAEGVDVATDVYPYTASSTRLTARLPTWAMDGGPDALLERLADPAARARIADDVRARFGRTLLPDGIVIAALPEGPYRDRTGESIARIAADEGVDPAEAMLRVLESHRALVFIVDHSMHEDDVELALAHPGSAVASDGWDLDTSAGGHPHPRHYGTFARALSYYTRELAAFGLPDAIRKMTSLPADRLGLTDRGRLTEGRAADLVVFDPATVTDNATYAAPLAYASGIDHVLVNGRPALLDGTPTGLRPGRVLRHP